VNAQKKNLDVWLIYRCSLCDTTWNLAVLSRVNPLSISPETLHGFHDNDPALAMQLAADVSLIRKSGGKPGLPSIEVEGAAVDLTEPVRICLAILQPTEIKVLDILREKLGLSRSALERMHGTGQLRFVSGETLRKCKLAGEIIIEIG